MLGEWQVDAAGNRLVRGGEIRPLRHKAMALLVLLARHPGETVARETIVDVVWDGNQFVAPKAINTAIWAIRQALGDDPEAPRYLETIAKKGYRLIAPVAPIAPASPVAPVMVEVPDRPSSPHGASKLTAAGALVLVLAAAAVWFGWPHLRRAPVTLAVATPLTQNPGQEYLGQVSPDGQWLALAWWQGQGDGQLFLRPADTLDAAPRLISGDAGEVQGLSWAPDGRAIAFVASGEDGRCTLWRYDLADARRHALARCTALFTPSVAWSPDGRWIAFSAEADGAGGLFAVAPDGRGLRRLTTAPPAARADHQPAWSPDGRLAFARQDPADGTRDLYELTPDGTLRRLSSLRLHSLHGLTYAAGGEDLVFSTTRQDSRVLLRWDRAASAAVPLGMEGSAPVQHADGRLVYALMRSHISIARLAAGGSTPQKLMTSVSNDRMPDVAPRSGQLVFVSHRSGHAELWHAEADGSQASALTHLEGQAAAPTWAPDGRWIAFLGHCGPGKRFGLCALDTNDRTTRPLAADAARYGRPAWHPSLPEVWVASDRGGSWQLWRFGLDGSSQALATEQPPGSMQWTADGAALIYRPRFSHTLRWRPAAGGSERTLALSTDPAHTLVDWRLGRQGLVVLTRGADERFLLIDPASGAGRRLSQHPLGTFPELASFALAADGSLRVELADTVAADLMQIR